MFNDFEDFKLEISWFIQPNDKVTVTNGKITTSTAFATSFPILNNLINKARVIDVKINSDTYKLFAWTTKEGYSCGWLCKFESPALNTIEILPEHQLLLDNIGGIEESFGEPEDSFTLNQNFLFIQSECSRGIEGWMEYYQPLCKQENVVPIPTDHLISFVCEANGAKTLYDLQTKQVYLFSHDHDFENVTVVEGQPEYTFHYINGVNNFIEYAEALALQWTAHIQQ
jgi:hypothetical protein